MQNIAFIVAGCYIYYNPFALVLFNWYVLIKSCFGFLVNFCTYEGMQLTNLACGLEALQEMFMIPFQG
jgi:hypothetical protein